MALLQIGRFGEDADVEVESWQESGDVVRVSGDFAAQSVSLAKIARQQITGYVNNPDVDAVPVVWSEDDTVDGFYTVEAAQVDVSGAALVTGLFVWSATLRKVPGYAGPLLESGLVGDVRDNVHSVTSCNAWMALPTDYTSFSLATADLDAVASADGDVYLYETSKSAAFDFNGIWSVDPADLYAGSARIRQDLGTYRTVVGRQTQNIPEQFRLSNGLVRVEHNSGSGGLSLSHYDGTQWDPSKDFDFAVDVGSGFIDVSEPTSFAVLRNSPERVVIRLTYPLSISPEVVLDTTVDVGLRRGSRMAEVVMRSSAASLDVDGLRVSRSSTEAATSITAGIEATSADGDGNKYIMLSPDTITKDTTDGRLTSDTGVTSFTFGLGSLVGGGSSPYDRTGMTDRYFAAMNEHVRVVTR